MAKPLGLPLTSTEAEAKFAWGQKKKNIQTRLTFVSNLLVKTVQEIGGQTNRYVGFTRIFFNYLLKKKAEKNEWVADFRSLIINTRTNPIQLTEKTWEDGFYKFYFHFLTRSLFSITNKADTEFELNVADKTDSYKFRTEVLQITTSGALKNNYPNCTVNEIKRDRPKQSRVHQLVDVLLGCVTYRFNEKDSENKKALVEYFEKRIGTPLNVDFKPFYRPINVWGWSSKGQERWVKGATGIVGIK